MLYLVLNWTLGTTGLTLLAVILPGFRVDDLRSAVIAAAVVALVHAAVSSVFRPGPGETASALPGILQVPLDTIVFRVVALLVPGFAMRGMLPALAGGLLLMGVNAALPRLFRTRTVTAQPVMNS